MQKITTNELDEIIKVEDFDPDFDFPADLTPIKQCHEYLVEATLCDQSVIQLYLVDDCRFSVLARIKKSKDIVSAYILQEMLLPSSSTP